MANINSRQVNLFKDKNFLFFRKKFLINLLAPSALNNCLALSIWYGEREFIIILSTIFESIKGP